MKIISLVPYWMDYAPGTGLVSKKGLQRLGGRYLFNYSLQLINRSSLINETVIFASSPAILEFIEPKLQYTYLERPRFLDDDSATIEAIIGEFLKHSDAEIIVLLHPNSPFLRVETMNECIEAVCQGSFDSAFTAYKLKKLAWFKGKPLNYSLAAPTPHLRDLEPVTIEQSSLYVFHRRTFEKTGKRIGNNPYIKYIDHFEGHEVNEPEDLEMAELIVNSGMFS